MKPDFFSHFTLFSINLFLQSTYFKSTQIYILSFLDLVLLEIEILKRDLEIS